MRDRHTASLLEYQIPAVLDTPHLLVDEATLFRWSGVVLELERPVKRLARFEHKEDDKDLESELKGLSQRVNRRFVPETHGGFGMPGTVLCDGGEFHAWFDQDRPRLYTSRDGLLFTPHKEPLQWQPQPGLDLGEDSSKAKDERELLVDTWTVTRDDDAPAAERYKSAFHCGVASHAPAPDFYKYKYKEGCTVTGRCMPREDWTAAPYYGLEKSFLWESTCLAHSSDGVRWRHYDLGHSRGIGPAPLRSAGDTANSVYYDAARKRHVVTNRWNVAVPNGTRGTAAYNPNWWREARCARLSSNPSLTKEPRRWSETAAFCLDRDGPLEHARRQIYAFQVTPSEDGVYMGTLTTLEWGKLRASLKPPHEWDVMRTYLVTSRDGDSFDLEWVYAQQELIPHGRCRAPSGCASVVQLARLSNLDREIASGANFDQLCCPFDHGIVYPASQLTKTDNETLLYYEGRGATHGGRYSMDGPGRGIAAIGVAAWKRQRLAGVRADPSTDGCGQVVTKPLPLLQLRSQGGAAAEFLYATVSVRANRSDGSSVLRAEVLRSRADNGTCADPRGGDADPRRSAALSLPIGIDHHAAVLRWKGPVKGRRHANLLHGPTGEPLKADVRLRFILCGETKLFSFALHAGKPPRELPPPRDYPMHNAVAAEALEQKELLERRAAQLAAYGGRLGLCEEDAEPEAGQCRNKGSYSTKKSGISDVDDCLRACARCAACAYISVSFEAPHWRCDWFATCDLQRLLLPRYLEASHPAVTEGHELIPAYEEGGFTWMSMAFDRKTLCARADFAQTPACRRRRRPRLPGWAD